MSCENTSYFSQHKYIRITLNFPWHLFIVTSSIERRSVFIFISPVPSMLTILWGNELLISTAGLTYNNIFFLHPIFTAGGGGKSFK